MIMEKVIPRTLVALGVLLAGARIGLADIIVTDDSHNTLTGEFQYTVELATGAKLVSGDGLVIYDFPDLVTSGPDAPTLVANTPAGAATFAALTFNVDQSLLGNSLSALSPSASNTVLGFVPNDADNSAFPPGSDNPNVENVSIVYNGSSPLGPTADYLGTLTLYTSLTGPGVTVNVNGTTASKDSSGPGEIPSSDEETDSGNVTVPVPEPTSLGILGIMGVILGGGRRLRTSKP
jgi:hypothetical protein